MTIIAILLATVVAFIFSSIFYQEKIAGKAWAHAVWIKMDKAHMSSTAKMTGIFLTTFVMYFLQFFVMSFFMSAMGVDTYSEAIIIGVLFWFLISSASYVKSLYEQKKCMWVFLSALDDLCRILLWVCVIIWWIS